MQLVIRDPQRLSLCCAECFGHMHGDRLEAKLPGGQPARVADHDHSRLIDDDRLSEAELEDRLGDSIDGRLVMAGIFLVGLNAIDGPVFDFHVVGSLKERWLTRAGRLRRSNVVTSSRLNRLAVRGSRRIAWRSFAGMIAVAETMSRCTDYARTLHALCTLDTWEEGAAGESRIYLQVSGTGGVSLIVIWNRCMFHRGYRHRECPFAANARVLKHRSGGSGRST